MAKRKALTGSAFKGLIPLPVQRNGLLLWMLQGFNESDYRTHNDEGWTDKFPRDRP